MALTTDHLQTQFSPKKKKFLTSKIKKTLRTFIMMNYDVVFENDFIRFSKTTQKLLTAIILDTPRTECGYLFRFSDYSSEWAMPISGF